jgi:hypothetical protein
MRHLPGPGFVPISAGGKRTDGTNVDAHAALLALEVILLVRSNNATRTAVLDAERPDIHALAADADTAVAEDAPRAIEKDYWGPLLLLAVLLDLDEFGFMRAVLEGHILELALATRVAHGAIERMIA